MISTNSFRRKLLELHDNQITHDYVICKLIYWLSVEDIPISIIFGISFGVDWDKVTMSCALIGILTQFFIIFQLLWHILIASYLFYLLKFDNTLYNENRVARHHTYQESPSISGTDGRNNDNYNNNRLTTGGDTMTDELLSSIGNSESGDNININTNRIFITTSQSGPYSRYNLNNQAKTTLIITGVNVDVNNIASQQQSPIANCGQWDNDNDNDNHDDDEDNNYNDNYNCNIVNSNHLTVPSNGGIDRNNEKAETLDRSLNSVVSGGDETSHTLGMSMESEPSTVAATAGSEEDSPRLTQAQPPTETQTQAQAKTGLFRKGTKTVSFNTRSYNNKESVNKTSALMEMTIDPTNTNDGQSRNYCENWGSSELSSIGDPDLQSTIILQQTQLMSNVQYEYLQNPVIYRRWVRVILIISLISTIVPLFVNLKYDEFEDGSGGTYGHLHNYTLLFSYKYKSDTYASECWIDGYFELIYDGFLILSLLFYFIVVAMCLYKYCETKKNVGNAYWYLFKRLLPWVIVFGTFRIIPLIDRLIIFSEFVFLNDSNYYTPLSLALLRHYFLGSLGIANAFVWVWIRKVNPYNQYMDRKDSLGRKVRNFIRRQNQIHAIKSRNGNNNNNNPNNRIRIGKFKGGRGNGNGNRNRNGSSDNGNGNANDNGKGGGRRSRTTQDLPPDFFHDTLESEDQYHQLQNENDNDNEKENKNRNGNEPMSMEITSNET